MYISISNGKTKNGWAETSQIYRNDRDYGDNRRLITIFILLEEILASSLKCEGGDRSISVADPLSVIHGFHPTHDHLRTIIHRFSDGLQVSSATLSPINHTYCYVVIWPFIKAIIYNKFAVNKLLSEIG